MSSNEKLYYLGLDPVESVEMVIHALSLVLDCKCNKTKLAQYFNVHRNTVTSWTINGIESSKSVNKRKMFNRLLQLEFEYRQVVKSAQTDLKKISG